MGCRCCFLLNRLEVLLDEDDSRSSSRVREHGSFLLVSQPHVAIQTLWSQCLFPWAVCRRWSKCHIHFLIHDFFRFHHNCFRDTISWECIVEYDCIRSCALSKLYIHPVQRILVPFPLFACTMQDVVWSNQSLADPYDSYSWDSRL